MAQFRATIKGSRGMASRLGTKASGLSVHVDGWSAGVSVYVHHDSATGEDVFEVWRSGGSNGDRGEIDLIGEVRGKG